MSQPPLFAPPPVAPAEPDAALEALGRALPDGVLLGTSTWSFPGWRGLVWRETETAERLAREGLTAYAAHPLLRAVGVDRSGYAPVSTEDWARYAAQVPPSFRFVVKAWQELLWARFPRGERHGARAGADNPHFLDAELAREAVVEPLLRGLGDKLGWLVLQFPPQPPVPDFAARLVRFARALPPGLPLAVEIRTPALLGPAYIAALREIGASHVLTIHPSMPDLRTQWRGAGIADEPALIVRWNLRPDLRYESAKANFAPFDRLRAPDPLHREQLARAIRWALERDRPAVVIANNKAEGSAPLTLRALAEAVVGLAEAGDRGPGALDAEGSSG